MLWFQAFQNMAICDIHSIDGQGGHSKMSNILQVHLINDILMLS